MVQTSAVPVHRISQDWIVLFYSKLSLYWHFSGESPETFSSISQAVSQDINGTNTYAVLSSPRAPGVEAIIISASWVSRIDDGNGTLNLRGVATVLGLANFLKRESLTCSNSIFSGPSEMSRIFPLGQGPYICDK